MKSAVFKLFLFCILIVNANGQNLISNGTFEFGGPGNGFNVDGLGYLYQTQPFSGNTSAGDFTIINNPQVFNTTFFSITQDHTSGNGNMMVMDGTTSAGIPAFWKAGDVGSGICNLTIGQSYQLNYWLNSISNLVTGISTQADIHVNFTNASNIQIISPSTLAPLPNQGWQPYYIQFDATNTCVTIEMVNQNSGITGNDFAIDDISLMPIGNPLTLSISSTRPNCSDSLSGIMIGYVYGGTSPYSYELTGLFGTAINSSGIFTGLESGNYDMVVTDINGQQVSLINQIIYPNNFLQIAPADTSICPTNSVEITVSGLLNANYFWTAFPSDPLFLNNQGDSVQVSPSITTVYSVYTNDIHYNLVSNGNFEAGNSAFYSELNYLNPNNPLTLPGAYGVTTNANFWETGFSPCVDHTFGTGIGKMLIIDGSTYGNMPIWKQVLAVEPNKDYTFSYYAQTVLGSNPAILFSSVNGQELGQDTLNSSTCNWELISYTWNSGNNTLASFEIIDLNNSLNGNDFALDDINVSTLQSCSQNSNIVVLTGNPELGLSYPNSICANDGNFNPNLGFGIPSNGTFSSIPSGLNINPLNGIVTGIGSSPGIYEIIYSVVICNTIAKDTFQLEIRPIPNLTSLTGGQYNCLSQSFDSVSLFVNFSTSFQVFYAIDNVSFSTWGNNNYTSLGNQIGLYTLDSITDGFCSNVLNGSLLVDSLNAPWTPIIEGDSIICSNEPSGSMLVVNGIPNSIITWYSDPGLTNVLGNGTEYYPSNDSSATYYAVQEVNGCMGLPMSFHVSIKPCDFIIPTAFTPDNDGENDIWEIVGLDAKYPLNQVQIFNRWGELLYTSVIGNYNFNPWDGTFKDQKLPVGSYYYIIELATDQSIEPINGIVSILRKP